MTRSKRVPGPSPSSRLAELSRHFPPMRSSPASITWGSVESRTMRQRDARWRGGRAIAAMSGTPSRPT